MARVTTLNVNGKKMTTDVDSAASLLHVRTPAQTKCDGEEGEGECGGQQEHARAQMQASTAQTGTSRSLVETRRSAKEFRRSATRCVARTKAA